MSDRPGIVAKLTPAAIALLCLKCKGRGQVFDAEDEDWMDCQACKGTGCPPPTPSSLGGMEWTRERPTAEGWYWQRIFILKTGQESERVMRRFGDLYQMTPYFASKLGVEWAGPIPEPSPLPEGAEQSPPKLPPGRDGT